MAQRGAGPGVTPRRRALLGVSVWGAVALSAGVGFATGAIGSMAAALAGATGLFGVGWFLLPALTRPELGLAPATIRRGTHPGRAALTIDGAHPALLPVLAEAGVQATFFVEAGAEAPYRDAGHEVGLRFAGVPRQGRVRAAWARSGARWLRCRWILPGLGDLPTVGVTARVTSVAEARRVVGTDIIAIGPIAPATLAAVLEELRSRAVEPTTLSEALEPTDGSKRESPHLQR